MLQLRLINLVGLRNVQGKQSGNICAVFVEKFNYRDTGDFNKNYY